MGRLRGVRMKNYTDFRWLESFLPYRRPFIIATHVLLVTVAYLSAFLLRFEFELPISEWECFLRTLPLLLLIRTVVFARSHLYEGLWRYVGVSDIIEIIKAVTAGSLIFVACVLAFFGHGFARSIFVLEWLLCLALVSGIRFVLRAFRESRLIYQRKHGKRVDRMGQSKMRRAFIIGAGDAGEMLLREINRTLFDTYEIVGFVDDDPRKQGRRIHGVEVVGTIGDLPELCRAKGIDELLIAIPSATQDQRRRIVEWCRNSGVSFKSIPALSDLLKGKATIGELREVRPEDLLGREAVWLNLDHLKKKLEGKRILVTGAGGSIGSELCRQLATLEPDLLVLFERAENSLYFIHLELESLGRRFQVVPVVGDIMDRQKVEEVITEYSPEVIFHTAAYKHVPLMEAHPLEAIRNNVFGTETVALAAKEASVERFVLISTDKAVRPVGVMGMTKRLAERLVLLLNGGPTTFVAVRFGNVLGSDGSVLPIFRWQIAKGGPLTVTDPEAARYFMLISEAAQLVLQAGLMGKGGEIFFLDMGEPIRIIDLAENLVRLSGLEPGRDIQIEIVGLRPGERLHEELVEVREELFPTEHEKVFKVLSSTFGLGGLKAQFEKDFEQLRYLVAKRDREGAVAKLAEMATRY